MAHYSQKTTPASLNRQIKATKTREWKAQAEILSLRLENKRLRKALEFYANEKTYETNTTNQWEPVTPIDKDNGEIARKALED